MGWYGMGGGMGWEWLFVLFLVAGVVTLVVILVRGWDRGGAPPSAGRSSSSNAEVILAERYARGEIDDDEHRRRLRGLRGE